MDFGEYTGEICVNCGRERVMLQNDRRVCEKCRWDQDAGAYYPEPDPLDQLARLELLPVSGDLTRMLEFEQLMREQIRFMTFGDLPELGQIDRERERPANESLT